MIVLKILAAPFVVVLTVLAAVVSFLFCMATAVFVVASLMVLPVGVSTGSGIYPDYPKWFLPCPLSNHWDDEVMAGNPWSFTQLSINTDISALVTL